MNRLLSSLMLSAFFVCAPVAASAAVAAPSASDRDTIVALEFKLFTHPDTQRTTDERVAKLEQFVYGSPKSGELHARVAALAGSVSHLSANTNTTSEREKQISQARSQLRPARIIPSDSIVPPGAKVTMVPQIVIPRQARVQTVCTVVDRIESLEIKVFGRRECAKKLQVRVAKLEKSLFGTADTSTAETITDRVNRLWFAYIGTIPSF